MTTLVLTRFFPDDPAVHTHGIYGRLRTLVQGAAAVDGRVHLLYFSDRAEQLAREQDLWTPRLADYYGVPVTFSVAPVQPHRPAVRGSYAGLLAGAFSWLKQDVYYRLAGAEPLHAFESAVAGADRVLVHRLNCMPPVMASRRALPPVYLDMDDIEHVALARALAQPPHWLSKRLGWLHLPALKQAERAAVRKAAQTLEIGRAHV